MKFFSSLMLLFAFVVAGCGDDSTPAADSGAADTSTASDSGATDSSTTDSSTTDAANDSGSATDAATDSATATDASADAAISDGGHSASCATACANAHAVCADRYSSVDNCTLDCTESADPAAAASCLAGLTGGADCDPMLVCFN